MADFNPNKYQKIVKQGVEQQAGFDPSKYQRISAPQSPRDRLMEDMRQRMASTEDLGRGTRAGLQNTGAFATSGLSEGMQIPRYDPEPTSRYGQSAITTGKILSSLIPGVGAERAVGAGLGAIKVLPQWLSRVGAGMAGGAASAPSVDVSPTTGAAIGGVAGAIPSALTGAMGKFLGKNVTPEQFESARQAVPSTIRAPIGELANSPRAKKLYGGARAIALSGADKPYQQMFDYLKKGTKELVKDAPGVSNPSQFVYDDIRRSYKAAKNKTDKAYDAVAKHADTNKVQFVGKKYLGSINNALKEIKNRSTKPVSIEKDLKVLSSSGQPFKKTSTVNVPLNKDVDELYKQSVETLKNFKKTPIDTFGDAVNLRKSLNKIIKKRYKTDDLESASFLQKIKSGLDDSIAESAKQNPESLGLHNAANDARIEQGTFEQLNRRDKSPFYKIYSKDGDPGGLISSHIRTSNKGDDFSGLLSALTEKLSPEAKSAVAKAHLNPTGDASLAKQMSKLEKLSSGQKTAMFGDKAQLAHELTALSGKFPAAKGADFTPLTGFTGNKQLQLLGEAAGIGAATHGGSPSLLGAALGLPAYGQVTQRVLRSKSLKDAYLKSLKQKAGGTVAKSTNKERLARTLALAAAGGTQDGT